MTEDNMASSAPAVAINAKPRVRCWSDGRGFDIGPDRRGFNLYVWFGDFDSIRDAWAAALRWFNGGDSPYPRPRPETPSIPRSVKP